MGLGGKSGESLLSMQLLVDMVTGQLGSEGEQCCASQISRVILAGNLLSPNTQTRDSMNKVKAVPNVLQQLDLLIGRGPSLCLTGSPRVL